MIPAGRFFRCVAHDLRSAGLLPLAQYAWWVAADYLCFEEAARNPAFDRRAGTDTAGIIPLWRLNIPSQNVAFGVRYEPISPQRFAFALSLLKCDFSKFTFLDLGCGKGRTLLMAAARGFGKVIGVEFAPEIAAIARRNCLIAGIPKIEVVTADAGDYMPPGGNMVIFLYNPFESPVMRRVLANLLASRRPKKESPSQEQCRGAWVAAATAPTSEAGQLYIVYLTPRCARLFDAERRLRRIFRAPSLSVWSLDGAAA